MRSGFAIVLLAALFAVTGCSSEENEEATNTNTETEQEVSGDLETKSEAYEQFIAAVDASDSLNIANSLYYTRADGASHEVKMLLNDSSEIVRIIEQYTVPGVGSIHTRKFYFKDDYKYATKEYFEEGVGENAHFVERVSYYDKGKVAVTKKRTAPFEDMLESEMFKVVDNYDCTDETVMRVLGQEGEFATTFRGFVQKGPELYLIVGEDAEDGYVSSLLVQMYTPTIKKLMANQASMIGTPLRVHFEQARDAGFTYQILHGVSIAE